MKKILFVLVAVTVFAVRVSAMSTVTFNGSDIVSLASLNTGQPLAGDGYIEFSNGSKFNNYSTQTSLDGFNQWISSFSSTEGISVFNLWLQGDASNQAALWGETIALANAYSTDIHPFASDGWVASVTTVGDQWGPAWKGRQLITYSAVDSASYLRSGTTASFGFSADIIGTSGSIGSVNQIWVGAGNDSDGTGIMTQAGNAVLFQRGISANVPEPTSILLLIMGLGFLGIPGWRRK